MSYQPSNVPQLETTEDVRKFLMAELEKIARSFSETIALDLRPVYREPVRPRDGMIVFADGTEWDPGSGAGSYEYVGGAWSKL